MMCAVASQITGVSIVCSSVCWSVDQRIQQYPASMPFVRGIHRWPVHYPHKWPVTGKMFPFDDVIMNAENVSIWWCDHDISPVQITFDLIFPTTSMLFLGVSMTVTHTKSYWYLYDHKMSLRFVMANSPLHCYAPRSISLSWLHECFYLGNLKWTTRWPQAKQSFKTNWAHVR